MSWSRIRAHHKRHGGRIALPHRNRVHGRIQSQHLRSANDLQRHRIGSDSALLTVDVVGGSTLVFALIIVCHIIDDQSGFAAALQIRSTGAYSGKKRDTNQNSAVSKLCAVFRQLSTLLLHPFVCGLRIAFADAFEGSWTEERCRRQAIRTSGQNFRRICVQSE